MRPRLNTRAGRARRNVLDITRDKFYRWVVWRLKSLHKGSFKIFEILSLADNAHSSIFSKPSLCLPLTQFQVSNLLETLSNAMPFGALTVIDSPIPVFAPSYSTGLIHYSSLSAIFITYRTLVYNVLPFVPSVLELEEEPLVTAAIAVYPISTLGAYNEYFHLVEVQYKGETFKYPISMILDNEAAIFLGREMYGYPKTFGHMDLRTETGSATFLGTVEKPKGQRIVQVEFTPDRPLEAGNAGRESKLVLGLRVIPNPVKGKEAMKELVRVAW